MNTECKATEFVYTVTEADLILFTISDDCATGNTLKSILKYGRKGFTFKSEKLDKCVTGLLIIFLNFSALEI